MPLPPGFPASPHDILDPGARWVPDERDERMEKLPPLVQQLREQVKIWRDKNYAGATDTGRSLLHWWFREEHLLTGVDGIAREFRYYFAQREAIETIVYLYEVAGVKDKYDMMRFAASRAVSTGMFDEDWLRFVIKMATGSGKTKVLSLALAWCYFHKRIDGDSHAEQKEHDRQRSARLNVLGIEVIRYTNEEVLNNLTGVYDDLKKRLAAREPPESPLSGGLAKVAVELTDFSVHYSQGSIAGAEESVKNGKSKIVADHGQIMRIGKDKTGKITREPLTRHWTDWIDYWAVDFDFESKREIIRVRNADTGVTEEQWSGDYIFENEWQSFRTRKDRSLELTSVTHECPPGRRKIAVKVVDIFGNDTMKIVEAGV